MMLGAISKPKLILGLIAFAILFFLAGFGAAVYFAGVDTKSAQAAAGTFATKLNYSRSTINKAKYAFFGKSAKPVFAVQQMITRAADAEVARLPRSLQQGETVRALGQLLNKETTEASRAHLPLTSAINDRMEGNLTKLADPDLDKDGLPVPAPAKPAAQDGAPPADGKAPAEGEATPPDGKATETTAKGEAQPAAPEVKLPPIPQYRVQPVVVGKGIQPYAVELAEFMSGNGAEEFAQSLQQRGLKVEFAVIPDDSGRDWYHVRTGRFADPAQANDEVGRIAANTGMVGRVVQWESTAKGKGDAAAPAKADAAPTPGKADVAAAPGKADVATAPGKADVATAPGKADAVAAPAKTDAAGKAGKGG